MFYPIDYSRNAAQLPRILAEDSGAPELRNPMLCTRKPLRLRPPALVKISYHETAARM